MRLLHARSNAPVWSRTQFLPPGCESPFGEVAPLEALGWAHNSFGDGAHLLAELHRPLTIASAVELSCEHPKAVVVAKRTIGDLIFLPPTCALKHWEVAPEVMGSSDTRGALGGLVFRCTLGWNDQPAERDPLAEEWLRRRRERRRRRRELNRGGALPESNAHPAADYKDYAFYMWITERAEIIYESVPPMRTEGGEWLNGSEVVARYGLTIASKHNGHAKKEMRKGFDTTLQEWTSIKDDWNTYAKRIGRLNDVLEDDEWLKLKRIRDAATVALVGIAPKEKTGLELKLGFECPTKPYVDTSVILNPNGINGFSFHWGGQCLSYNGVSSQSEPDAIWALFTAGREVFAAGQEEVEIVPSRAFTGQPTHQEESTQVGVADHDVFVAKHADLLASIAGAVYAETFRALGKAKQTLHALELKHKRPPKPPPPALLEKRDRAQKRAREAADAALATLAKRVVGFALSAAIDAVLSEQRRSAAPRLVDLRALNAGVKARAGLRYDAKEKEARDRERAALAEARAARRGR
jgi:hypothetical protein